MEKEDGLEDWKGVFRSVCPHLSALFVSGRIASAPGKLDACRGQKWGALVVDFFSCDRVFIFFCKCRSQLDQSNDHACKLC